MTDIFILCGLGLIMAELYMHTKRPKLYAVMNSVAGAAALISMQLLGVLSSAVNSFSSGFCAVMGIPGAVLMFILNTLQGV